MSNESFDDAPSDGRRSFLTGTTCALFTAGGAGLMTPYVKSWSPSARAMAAGAPISIDLTKISEGEMVVEEWRGRPIYVLKRSREMLESFESLDEQLRNPSSEDDQQPVYAKNDNRSIKPEFLVVEGLCTHLGCTPKFRPNKNEEGFTGFFCPCHGSKFDFAGRVYKGVPAPTNLKVPPHHYVDDNTLIVGAEKEETA
ncbi:MAG: ubiquinol-cytochrome c reductase iron-sulfur subunit [Halieaceae bacterium]|jgi:ubiquinol-cytochrome c reductase iron-sulfur subunit|nr:ubiquinol-cytochrome c reductase iron-sulfur subunit [Halieaceae bacterium]